MVIWVCISRSVQIFVVPNLCSSFKILVGLECRRNFWNGLVYMSISFWWETSRKSTAHKT